MGLRAGRGTTFGPHVAACAVAVSLAACAGARHRKVAGPPPEYERPDDPGDAPPRDGGFGSGPGDGATSNEPGSHAREAVGAAASVAEFMLISPDARP